MTKKWTFGKRLGSGFALAAVVLLVIAWTGFQSSRHLIESERLVNHTHEVRLHLVKLVAQLVDAETGGRGFVISGEDSFLEPYRSGAGASQATLDELRALTADRPSQQRRVAAIQPLLVAKLANLKAVIELRRNEGFDAAIRRVSMGQGKRDMDAIRYLVSDMDREERSLLETRFREAEASAAVTQAVTLWGSLFGALFVAFIGWLITTSLSKQVGATVQHVQSSSAELRSAANEQAVGSKQQVTATSEIATTISELLASSRQIADSAQRVAQIAEQTASAARLGEGTVQKANDSIASIRRQTDVIVSQLLELGKKSQQIGSVLDLLSELAEQTNILAVNATIEAAGAGDAGKRFAVVADEIRKLADRVAGSTKEVRPLIEDVRTAVNTTVMTTETGSKSVDAGLKLFGEVALAFKQITGQVATSAEAAREIELSTKQQTSAVEQVGLAVTSIAQATKETEASSGQTLQTASQLATLSRELLLLVRPKASG